MDFTNSLFIILITYGAITLSAGVLMLKKPPKKINHFYGYRTRQSMSSQERWKFAQIYSSKEMIRQGLIFICISLIGLFVSFEELINTMLAMLLIIVSVVLLLFKTEKSIKQKFKENETI